MSSIEDHIGNIIASCSALRESLEREEQQTCALNVRVLSLQQEAESLENTLKETLIELTSCREELNHALARSQQLEEENKAFSKVSHIVAMEKENTRLRAELEILTHRMNTSKISCTKENNPPVPVFVEKKIKGTTYLVDGDNTIYEKNDDDSAGKKLGLLKKTADGKMKVQWD